MWAKLMANKVLFFVIVAVVIVAICWLVGIGFHASVGKGGGDVGFTHSTH